MRSARARLSRQHAIDQVRIGLFQQKPADDRVDVETIGGVTEINGGSGDDSFYVNYRRDGLTTNAVQTDQNGIGTTVTAEIPY